MTGHPTLPNPLLDLSGLPRFAEIDAAQIEPALDQTLARCRQKITEIESACDHPTWDSVAAEIQDIEEHLERVWAPVSHLNAVSDSEAFRAAVEVCLPKLSDFSTELGQNLTLFDGYKKLCRSAEFELLSEARKKVVKNAIRDFRLSGAELQDDARDRFREISSELSSLSNKFDQNLLDATDQWVLDITDQADLRGLPQSAVDLACENAKNASIEGWRFTLQAPSYIPFMMFCENRMLRERMYEAYVTRASELGPNAGAFDNSALLVKIVALRDEMATLLGFETYADYALEGRMASSADEVSEFLQNLADCSRKPALEELRVLHEFASLEYGQEDLKAWDIAFYSEKLKQSCFDFNDEEIRPYFPLPKVLDGLFFITEKLFGIKIRKSRGESLWHEDVQFFELLNSDQSIRGCFYLDLYARPHKRGGAWMSDCVGRRRLSDDAIQKPAAMLTCNFTPPVGGHPSLLTHDDVVTLFHEFGHGLHHLLTQVDESSVAGINGVPWDAVELPSQFLENWCWEAEALNKISGHFETGAPLPPHLLDRMRGARNFQSAMQMLRQIEFSVFDMTLHDKQQIRAPEDIQNILDEVRNRVAVLEAPAFNRFQNSFSHIFAGGYAAGYYSYKWAEVLSADAFGRFEEDGILDAKSGQDFLRSVLETGGVNEPLDNFTAFRGRPPSIDALLRHSGLGA
jgi:oligopeptidase A